MPKADTEHTTASLNGDPENRFRRRLLAGATAALAAGAAIATGALAAPVASPEGAGDDAELIALCDRLVANQREERQICIADEWAPDRGPLHAKYKALWAEYKQLRDRIYAAKEPVSLAGIQAVSRAGLVAAQRDHEGNLVPDSLCEWLLLSLALFHAGPEFEAQQVELALAENAA